MLASRNREHARPDVVAAARPDEGCGVAALSGISARGWREVLRRTVLRVFEARLLGEAAAVAFYALLALFPAAAALVWLCGLLADPPAAAERLRHGVAPHPAARIQPSCGGGQG